MITNMKPPLPLAGPEITVIRVVNYGVNALIYTLNTSINPY